MPNLHRNIITVTRKTMRQFYLNFICTCYIILQGLSLKAQWNELYTAGYPKLYAAGTISTLLVTPQQEVFTGGSFSDASSPYLASYGGVKWRHWCNVNNQIYTLAHNDNGVFAAGYFTDSAGGYYVMQQVGATCYRPGNTTFNGAINALCSDKFSNIYASGNFTNGFNEQYIAKFDGIQWTELSNGSNRLMANNTIQSIAADTFGNVYAAGSFTNGTASYYVAKWNGLQWTELGNLNANGIIYRITTDAAGNVYATGSFTNSSGKRYIAKWNGANWSELGGNNALQANGIIWAIAADNAGNIYAAGEFTNSNGKKYVAKFDGTIWSEQSANGSYLNANDVIFAVACGTDGKVYCAGDFTNTDGNNYVAVFTPVATSIAALEKNAITIQVYPNPFTETLEIKSFALPTNTTFLLEIYDVSGRIINTPQLITNHVVIETSGWSPGFYTARVYDAYSSTYRSIQLVKTP
jgi:hypothetical protein